MPPKEKPLWSKTGANVLEQAFWRIFVELFFVRCKADTCMFIRRNDSEKVLIVLYVDNGLVASINKEQLENFLRDLKKEFKITTKPAKYYLGFEIYHQEDDLIKLCQTAYTKKVLERFGMSECKPVLSKRVLNQGK